MPICNKTLDQNKKFITNQYGENVFFLLCNDATLAKIKDKCNYLFQMKRDKNEGFYFLCITIGISIRFTVGMCYRQNKMYVVLPYDCITLGKTGCYFVVI